MVAAIFTTSISTVAFAASDSSGRNRLKTYQNDKELDKEHKQDEENSKIDEDASSVTDCVYNGNKGKDKNDEKDNFDKANLNNVTVTIYTYGETKTPAEVVDILVNNNISLKTIAKAVNVISENKGNKYPGFSESTLKAYSDAILAKVEAKKVELQDRISSLEELTNLYNKIGDLEKAINTQKRALKDDFKNILSYKKLGEMLNKKGEKDIKVFTVGEQVYFQDVQPVIKSDRTLIPIRAVSNSLKADVKWDEATHTVTITKGGTEIKLVLGNDTAIINGQEVKLDVPAETINDRTMVPVRFVSEAFKSTVQWEPEHQIVIIY